MRFLEHRPKPARIAAEPAARSARAAVAPRGASGRGTGARDRRPPAASEPRGPSRAKEIGGPGGPEPTRYGDWERNGICVDF